MGGENDGGRGSIHRGEGDEAPRNDAALGTNIGEGGVTVITEMALERVEFTCGHCWHRWSIDYDIQHYRDDDGHDWEYFYRDGIAAASPYTSEGAVLCPECGRHWVGHLVARREIPTAPGPHGTPRQPIGDVKDHRPERHGVPLLGAQAHPQPEQLASSAGRDD